MHSLWHSSLHLSANYRISEDQLPLVWVLGIVLWLFFFVCLKKENKQQNKTQKTQTKNPKPFPPWIEFLPIPTFSLALTPLDSELSWKDSPILDPPMQLISFKKCHSTNSYQKRNHNSENLSSLKLYPVDPIFPSTLKRSKPILTLS